MSRRSPPAAVQPAPAARRHELRCRAALPASVPAVPVPARLSLSAGLPPPAVPPAGLPAAVRLPAAARLRGLPSVAALARRLRGHRRQRRRPKVLRPCLVPLPRQWAPARPLSRPVFRQPLRSLRLLAAAPDLAAPKVLAVPQGAPERQQARALPLGRYHPGASTRSRPQVAAQRWVWHCCGRGLLTALTATGEELAEYLSEEVRVGSLG